jgi:hypothetical protein
MGGRVALEVTLGGGKRSWRGMKEVGDWREGGWVGEEGGEEGGEGGGSGRAIARFAGGGAAVGEVVEELVLVAGAAGESWRFAVDCAVEVMSASSGLICDSAIGSGDGGATVVPMLAAVSAAMGCGCTSSAGTAGSAGSASALPWAGVDGGGAAFFRPCFGRFRFPGACESAPVAVAVWFVAATGAAM